MESTEDISSWAAKQAYLAMGNLLTVCAVEEIDACPMEGFIPEKYNEILKLHNLGLTSILVLPIGYRAKDDMFSELKKVRRSIGDTVITI
jgi:nitroreductase